MFIFIMIKEQERIFSCSKRGKRVTENVPAILLAENNKHDVEFMLKALENYNFTDNIKVFHDGKVDRLDILQRRSKETQNN